MLKNKGLTRIGIISDTHGRLPAAVHGLFDGVDLILHAGDVGNMEIIRELEYIAPVYAVYGNVDGDNVRRRLEFLRQITIDGYTILLTHMPARLDTPEYDKGLIKIFGHTHYPEIVNGGDVITLNPGSASQPRGVKMPSVAMITLAKDSPPQVEIINL